MSTADVASKAIRSTIPARLDRLSWSPFHTRMVCGLGAALREPCCQSGRALDPARVAPSGAG